MAYSLVQYVESIIPDIGSSTLMQHVSLFIVVMAATFWGLSWICYNKVFKKHDHGIVYHLAINLAIEVTAIHCTQLFIEPIPIKEALPRLGFISYMNILLQVAIYTVVVYHWRFKQHSIELEVLLKRSELTMLRMQTNPHFLFNTLNLISNEIPENKELAQELIYDLSDLLRGTISLSNQKRVKISEEIELVTHYLNIQKSRFGKRLETQLYLDAKAQDIYIPPMLVLPLVENVIKHAVSRTLNTVVLQIHIFNFDDGFTIRVNNSWSENNAPAFKFGSGLQNITDTLKLEYEEAYLDVGHQDGESYSMITIKNN